MVRYIQRLSRLANSYFHRLHSVPFQFKLLRHIPDKVLRGSKKKMVSHKLNVCICMCLCTCLFSTARVVWKLNNSMEFQFSLNVQSYFFFSSHYKSKLNWYCDSDSVEKNSAVWTIPTVSHLFAFVIMTDTIHTLCMHARHCIALNVSSCS